MAEQQKYSIKNGKYTLPEFDGSNAARELQRPSNLPEERKQPVRTKKVKAKLAVAPFAVAGIMLVLMLAVMVVMGYVRLYEAKSVTGNLNDQISEATEESSRLRSQYESLVDFDQIELYATSHGMKKPTSAQTVYVNVPHQDMAQIRIAEESNLLEKAWSAIRDGFCALMEYLQ